MRRSPTNPAKQPSATAATTVFVLATVSPPIVPVLAAAVAAGAHVARINTGQAETGSPGTGCIAADPFRGFSARVAPFPPGSRFRGRRSR